MDIVVYHSAQSAIKVRPNYQSAMISIISPNGESQIPARWRGYNFMVAAFSDASPERVPASQFGAYHANIYMQDSMQEADAHRIVRFVRRLPESIRTLHVHCDIGISRSPSVAACLADWQGAIRLRSAADFQRIKSTPLQNNHIVSLMWKAIRALPECEQKIIHTGNPDLY